MCDPLLLGLAGGAGVGAIFVTSSAEAGFCDVEPAIDFSNAAQTVMDTDDGEDEENEWFFHGGNDFGRSLACNDIDVNGQDDFDDMGGGSGTDFVTGGGNADDLFGGAGNDQIDGDDGDDDIEDLQANDFDVANGNDNSDTIDVRDGDPNDIADGGGGNDTCLSNNGDEEISC